MISSRWASAACAKDRKGPIEEEKWIMEGKKGGGKKKECLVWLIAVIVGSTAHPADLAELLTLFPGENFECGSISIDKRVIFVLIRGLLSIGMKRGAK
jgi:hypothetical protein